MFRKRDDGFILITVLLLLLVLTIIGLAAMGTSTIENILSGNMRLRERNLFKAEPEIAPPVIERAVREQDVQGFSSIVTDNDSTATYTLPREYLPTELRSRFFATDSTYNAPDITFTIDGQPVNIDIDKMHIKRIGGTAIEFASGYEGIGKSGSTGGFYTFYRINSVSTGVLDSEAEVGTIFRYISK